MQPVVDWQLLQCKLGEEVHLLLEPSVESAEKLSVSGLELLSSPMKPVAHIGLITLSPDVKHHR